MVEIFSDLRIRNREKCKVFLLFVKDFLILIVGYRVVLLF